MESKPPAYDDGQPSQPYSQQQPDQPHTQATSEPQPPPCLQQPTMPYPQSQHYPHINPQLHPQPYSQSHTQQYSQPYQPQLQPGAPGYNPSPVGVPVVSPGNVIVNQIAFPASAPMLGTVPVRTTCPSCQNSILTATSKKPGFMAWMLCIMLCIMGCIPCAFIPFCVDSMKDTTHTCPSCNAVIGVDRLRGYYDQNYHNRCHHGIHHGCS